MLLKHLLSFNSFRAYHPLQLSQNRLLIKLLCTKRQDKTALSRKFGVALDQFHHQELATLNRSAANSLMEGLEETLTLHQLGVFVDLGESFKTTNCIENLNSRLGKYLSQVKYWQRRISGFAG